MRTHLNVNSMREFTAQQLATTHYGTHSVSVGTALTELTEIFLHARNRHQSSAIFSIKIK